MLSKEERSKENLLSALQLLNCSRNCSACKYYSPDDIQKCQDPTPYAVDLLKELIEEHFEPKENTSEFKHFKLHSDSTLKNLTKVELIDYIKMLYHNWGVADEQLAHSLNAYNNLEEKYKSIDFTLDKQFEHIEEIEKILDVCGIVAIKKRVKELTNIKPYKFEDLKEDMWVWDNVAKECLYVIKPFVGSFTGVKYFSYLGIYKNLEEIRKLDMKFEENRFFPVQCANWNGSER